MERLPERAPRPAPLTAGEPIRCTIQVVGLLEPRSLARLGGLRPTTAGRGAARPGAVTELAGELLDQAALMGVLTHLYDLGLPLLSVTCRPALPDREPGGDRSTHGDRTRERSVTK